MHCLSHCAEGKSVVMTISELLTPDRPEVIADDDWPLVRHCRQGDDEAFRTLVEKYQGRVSSIMWRFSRDFDVHQDLVQDVFVEVYTSLKNYRPQAPFFHWLSRIAVRVGYRYWKKQKKEQENLHVSLDDWEQLADPHISDVLASKEAADLLHRLLAQLTPRNRLVLTLRFIDERSVEETSGLTGWSKSMVKVQTLRARGELKKLLDRSQEKL